MGRYFGTDGFRGEANKNLTAEHAYKVGRFLGWYFRSVRLQRGDSTVPRIVIGKDTRRSCYMFEYMLSGGIVASGCDVYLMHVTTTPSVAYIARTDDFDCGIMITASHNPYYDNGIKVINRFGEKMEESVTDLCEDYIDGHLECFGQKWEELPYAHRQDIGQMVDYVSGRNRYIGYLLSLSKYSFSGKKIGLDCANGTTWHIARSVFEALGAKVSVVGNEPNGFNVNEGCGSTHIENLQRLVRDDKLDVGFAFDGDADRCLAVDEKGNVVTGDHIMCIYAIYMKNRSKLIPNTVVATVMSNYGFFKALEANGIGYAKTKVGDKYVHDYMVQNGCRLGGEQSGHIIYAKYASTGDGLLTALKIMEVMVATGSKLSELASVMQMYPQVLVNVRVNDKSSVMNDEDVLNSVKEAEKELEGSGRILVRESGTEPVVRVMAEAPYEDMCHKYVDKVVDVIKKKGYAI